MNRWPLQDGGWTLAPAADADFDEIMTWFPDADSVDIWGGPNFRYPFTGETFREDCRIDLMSSFALRSNDGRLAAFGQSYERDGRGHLARLVSNPSSRGQGAGKQLIRMTIAALENIHGYDEYSLFVYRHNVPAYRCYLSLGFRVVAYPDDAPMPDKCFFLTRKATRKKS
ncbi:MAG: GNAT family N-acetyltransferase [Gammaproteobacteria bacterium]|nr:GNAT family N-acetyltransferase [Gammaproteobacteria bacterium]